MPDFRRFYVPGGTYFFTLVTADRSPFLCEPAARGCLREALHECRARWPFAISAIVLLPDHLHAIWSLPSGDSEYSRRWAFVKHSFTRRWLSFGLAEAQMSPGWRRQRRRGVWQPRFWEHLIRNETDLARHVDYIVYNPVKHGLCQCPRSWPYSSFLHLVRQGDYELDWGCNAERDDSFQFSDIAPSVRE